MFSNTNIRLLLLSLPFLLQRTVAQLQCDLGNNLVNASDSIRHEAPFQAPGSLLSNRSFTWTWTLATQSSPLRGNETTISQVLRLNIAPELDLLAPDFNFTGCGIIAHGLSDRSRTLGLNDTTGYGCGDELSDECQRALTSGAQLFAETAPFGSTSPSRICDDLSRIGNGRNGLPKECENDFTRDGWLEPFAFADPDLNGSSCAFNPAASNASNAIHTWGYTTQAPGNLTSYNNLTTLVEPIVTVLQSHERIANGSLWGQAYLMCLRTGENVTEGSAPAPTTIPGSGSGRIGAPSLLLASLFVLSALFGVIL